MANPSRMEPNRGRRVVVAREAVAVWIWGGDVFADPDITRAIPNYNYRQKGTVMRMLFHGVNLPDNIARTIKAITFVAPTLNIMADMFLATRDLSNIQYYEGAVWNVPTNVDPKLHKDLLSVFNGGLIKFYSRMIYKTPLAMAAVYGIFLNTDWVARRTPEFQEKFKEEQRLKAESESMVTPQPNIKVVNQLITAGSHFEPRKADAAVAVWVWGGEPFDDMAIGTAFWNHNNKLKGSVMTLLHHGTTLPDMIARTIKAITFVAPTLNIMADMFLATRDLDNIQYYEGAVWNVPTNVDPQLHKDLLSVFNGGLVKFYSRLDYETPFMMATMYGLFLNKNGWVSRRTPEFQKKYKEEQALKRKSESARIKASHPKIKVVDQLITTDSHLAPRKADAAVAVWVWGGEPFDDVAIGTAFWNHDNKLKGSVMRLLHHGTTLPDEVVDVIKAVTLVAPTLHILAQMFLAIRRWKNIEYYEGAVWNVKDVNPKLHSDLLDEFNGGLIEFFSREDYTAVTMATLYGLYLNQDWVSRRTLEFQRNYKKELAEKQLERKAAIVTEGASQNVHIRQEYVSESGKVYVQKTEMQRHRGSNSRPEDVRSTSNFVAVWVWGDWPVEEAASVSEAFWRYDNVRKTTVTRLLHCGTTFPEELRGRIKAVSFFAPTLHILAKMYMAIREHKNILYYEGAIWNTRANGNEELLETLEPKFNGGLVKFYSRANVQNPVTAGTLYACYLEKNWVLRRSLGFQEKHKKEQAEKERKRKPGNEVGGPPKRKIRTEPEYSDRNGNADVPRTGSYRIPFKTPVPPHDSWSSGFVRK